MLCSLPNAGRRTAARLQRPICGPTTGQVSGGVEASGLGAGLGIGRPPTPRPLLGTRPSASGARQSRLPTGSGEAGHAGHAGEQAHMGHESNREAAQ